MSPSTNHSTPTPLAYEALTLGALGTNCYLVWTEAQRQALIIDPADSGETISQRILELQLIPTAIVLTHGHFDHTLALLTLKLNFDLPIYLHADDWSIHARAATSAQHWLGHPVDPVPPPTQTLSADNQFQLGEHSLQVIHTPGHTPGSVSLYSESAPTLFTGDTLFLGAVGRADHSYSSPRQLAASLDQLLALPEATTVLPGHGQPTTIGLERALRYT